MPPLLLLLLLLLPPPPPPLLPPLPSRTPTIARPDKILPIYCRELLAVLRSPERLLFRACHLCCSCLNGAQPGCSPWLDPHRHHTLLLRTQPSLTNVMTHICSSSRLRCRRCCRPRRCCRCPCCSCCCRCLTAVQKLR